MPRDGHTILYYTGDRSQVFEHDKKPRRRRARTPDAPNIVRRRTISHDLRYDGVQSPQIHTSYLVVLRLKASMTMALVGHIFPYLSIYSPI